MDRPELIRRVDALLGAFDGRVPEETMSTLREFAEVGEEGELVSELTATLSQRQVPVTADERDELRALADATDEGHEFLEGLTVQ